MAISPGKSVSASENSVAINFTIPRRSINREKAPAMSLLHVDTCVRGFFRFNRKIPSISSYAVGAKIGYISSFLKPRFARLMSEIDDSKHPSGGRDCFRAQALMGVASTPSEWRLDLLERVNIPHSIVSFRRFRINPPAISTVHLGNHISAAQAGVGRISTISPRIRRHLEISR